MKWGCNLTPLFCFWKFPETSAYDVRSRVCMKRLKDELEPLIERVLDRLGLELIDLEQAGHEARPIIRALVDRIDSEPGRGVTVDECARASRELEAELDEAADLPATYILEVSSPGVERPLKKRSDFERYVGHEISVRGFQPLTLGTKRLEGMLLGIEGQTESEQVRIRLADNSEVEIPRSNIAKAQLIFRWDDFKFKERRRNKN